VLEAGEHMQETDRELLIRLDERVRNAVSVMEQRDVYHRQEMERLTRLMTDQMSTFVSAVTSISANFATKGDLGTVSSSVTRVERIVYGACGLILVAVIGALMTGVLGNPG
jgi:hypothetical protein